MLHNQLSLPGDRQRTHLAQVGGKFKGPRGNRFVKLERLIYKLDRSNQHMFKVSRFLPQIKQSQKTRGFSPQYCSTTEIVRISTSGLQRPIPI